MAGANHSLPQSSDKFQLLEELGTGNYGCVYRGTFQEEEVAIKEIHLLRLHLGAENREPEIMLQLCHHNILQLIHWEDQGEFR